MGRDMVLTDGIEVRVREQGSGPPLLLLHGWDGWGAPSPFESALAERHRVVVPEHPGFGRTPRLQWTTGVHDVALHYRQLVDRVFGDEPFSIVGHSLGGWLAAEYAVHFRDRLDGLVLIAPLGIRVPDLDYVDLFMWLGSPTLTEWAWHDPSLAPPLDDPTDLEVIESNAMLAQLAWSPRLHDPKLLERLRWITAPTTIVWGRQDRVIDPRHAEVFASHIEGAQVRYLDGAGHFPQLECPEACAAAVLEALDATPAAARA